jgi:hypothetical protein
MDNIHKIINLNGFISDLKQYYYIVTSHEVAYNAYIEKYKTYTLFYGWEYIDLLIVDNKYRLYQEWNGVIIECDTIEQLEQALYNPIQELEQNT